MDIINKAHPWVLFSLILMGVIIFLLLCTPARKPLEDPAHKALIKAKDDTLAAYKSMRARDSVAIDHAGQVTADQEEKLTVYKYALTDAQTTINRLAAKVKGAKAEPKDNTWVEVSPNYVKGCDSLADQVTGLNTRISEYEQESAELVKLMSYEVSLRDSVLNNEREFNAKFRAQLDNCMMQLKGKVDAKQRAQLYAGMGLIGNKVNPLGGAQVNLGLRARNSQMYEVTGMVVGNTWYAGVGTKFLISFKR
jgi:peptidoglycan hydrolase CwlO-like protein